MQMSTTHRLASVSGLLFSILEIAALAFFVVVAAPHMPSLDADPVVHGSFYTQFAMENALSNYLVLLPMPLFAIFVAALYHALPRGVTATTSLVTGTALSIIWPIGIVVAHGGQSMAQQGLDPLTVMTFDGIAQLMLGFAGLPRAVFLIATAFSLNRSKTLTAMLRLRFPRAYNRDHVDAADATCAKPMGGCRSRRGFHRRRSQPDSSSHRGH